MNPIAGLAYCFLFGLLHGVLPDEHTWPITFSYAIGGASGKEGLKAGVYFSTGFTVQRAIISELAYLALARFLLSPKVNGVVFLIVGVAMAVAGALVLRRNLHPHIHLLGHHHKGVLEMETTGHILGRHHEERGEPVTAPPAHWAAIHGFIAGFGFEGFAIYVNTIAISAMPNAWLGFLPGLMFGLGTMLVLIIVGAMIGASLRLTKRVTEEELKRIGAKTAGRTLFFGGWLFGIFGIATLLGLGANLPVDTGYILIGLFMVIIAVPAFIYTWKEVMTARKQTET